MTDERIAELRRKFYSFPHAMDISTLVREIENEITAKHQRIESELRCHILQLEQRLEDSQRKVKELSRDAEPPEPEPKKVFGGPYSENMWLAINNASDINSLQWALYLVCCRIGELEAQVVKK